MKRDYKMQMLNIEPLPDKATAKTIKLMIERDKYRWREEGLTQEEVKARIQKKLLACHIATNEKPYYHAYSLLARFRQKTR